MVAGRRVGVRSVEVLALPALHTDGAIVGVEQDPRGEVAHADDEPIGVRLPGRADQLARAGPAAAQRRQGREAHALELRLAPVIRVSRPEVGYGPAQPLCPRHLDRLQACLDERRVTEGQGGVGPCRAQPALVTVPCRVRLACPWSIDVSATLKPLEVGAHAVRAPRSVARQLGDVVPVAGVAIDCDHRVMGGAATERPRPRIEDAVLLRAKLPVEP